MLPIFSGKISLLELQNQGAHNLNLVMPTHCLPGIIPALSLAKEKGFNLPTLYNSGEYESNEKSTGVGLF